MLDLNGRIAVLGLGRSGEAVVTWALGRPDKTADDVVVFVEHSSPKMQAAAVALRVRGVRVELGASEVPDEGYSLVVASPGIAPGRPLMLSAALLGVPVISELELAYQVGKAPFVAITGTNGKTTTTALTAHLLRAGGLRAQEAGNIGRVALGVAKADADADVIVAECSSFQLALTLDFHPRVSVLLNITPDHLDWHGSLEAYATDKVRVFENQDAEDVAIIDMDDPGSAVWAPALEERGIRVVRVSAAGEGDARLEGDVLVVDAGHGDVALVTVDELRIRGAHNISNALAASAVALVVGVSADLVRDGLRSFHPIEHRLEPVGEVAGVAYVNDSKATNPDAVLKALTAFGERPVTVLLGGRNKGNDFGPLARACARSARLAVAYGECRRELAKALKAAGVQHVVVSTMAEAIESAAASARPGDVVLLSPACASYDEFVNYEDRGRRFTAAVAALRERSS